MKIIILFGAMLSGLLAQAQYSFPSNLAVSDADRIVERFGVSFLGKAPPSFLNDESRTQLSLSWNWVSTKHISKMGNGNSDRTLQFQEIYFTQELPYRVEIGFHSNLLIMNSSVSTYGGFARWIFTEMALGELGAARAAFRAYASSANFRNLMGLNMSGGLLELDLDFQPVLITVGFGQLRSMAQFKATVFELPGSQPRIRAGDSYAHQMLRLTYVMGRWNLSVQSDKIKNSQNSVLMGYVF